MVNDAFAADEPPPATDCPRLPALDQRRGGNRDASRLASASNSTYGPSASATDLSPSACRHSAHVSSSTRTRVVCHTGRVAASALLRRLPRLPMRT